LNDQPIGVRLLNKIGDSLVEIHGQFKNHGLMNPKTHQDLLDAFAQTEKEKSETKKDYHGWKKIERERFQLEKDLEKAKEDEEYLRHTVAELDELRPEGNEEEILAERRKLLMSAEKNIGNLRDAYDALNKQNSVSQALQSAQNALLRAGDESLSSIVDDLSATWDKITDVSDRLENLVRNFENPKEELEVTEERLFALRGLARKHRCLVSELPAMYEKLKLDLEKVDNSDKFLLEKKEEENRAKQIYKESANRLYEKRKNSAEKIEDAVHRELAPLKLENAKFKVALDMLPEDQWRESGCHTTIFEIAMNPGSASSPIHKTASGGELARLMLALKVVLAKINPVPVMVFDEVDTGISGATSSAVGERLKRLGENVQVLVVTHSPQVASNGHHHLYIQKETEDDSTTTTVFSLTNEQREREIARLLSGDEITKSALKNARELLG
ncbi:MAG: DNA repair protein RecN, partial [Alphaproteobacteria bacterium]